MSFFSHLPPERTLEASSFLLGITAHWTLYNKGEWDLAARSVCGVYLVAFALLAGLWSRSIDGISVSSLMHSFGLMSRVFAAHFTGLFASMGIYRGFMHRAGKFPGPFWARFSHWWITSVIVPRFHVFEDIQKLHAQYGDFVRIGPRSISITHPKATEALYSNKSICSKGPWYDMGKPRTTLFQARDKLEHNRRRKDWDRGFSSKALRDYEPRVVGYNQQLLDIIENHKGEPMDMAKWFNLYSFDVMGELSFGKTFNRLKEGKMDYHMETIHGGMITFGMFFYVPWMMHFFKAMPVVSSQINGILEYSRNLVEERKKMKLENPDVFAWILEAYQNNPVKNKKTQEDLYGDADLIVVAGSDTTAATLTACFLLLATHPEAVKELRKEMDEAGVDPTNVDHSRLSKLEYLDAVINETLRLYPAVASGLERLTPAQGITIGDTYIPGDLMVQMPMHTMNRDERYFLRADDFMPERWTSKPELIKDSSNCIPFSVGSSSCAGKQLALMELRQNITSIAHKYDIKLAPGQTVEKAVKGIRDSFTIVWEGGVELVFTTRTG